jgi:RNA polymerase sigma-70 factor (ECF subfamily)
MKLHETASVASLRLRDALHEENAFSMSGRRMESASLGKSAGVPSPDPSLFSEPKPSERRNEEFLTLLREAEPSLSRFARAMTRDAEAARDIVAETVAVALEKFETIANKQAFLSFLLTIASRLYKKKQWRLRFWGKYDDNPERQAPDPNASPELSADVSALYEAMAKLPREQREALILFEINGLSLEEVRAVQNCSLSAVKSRLARGRQKLADLLGVET